MKRARASRTVAFLGLALWSVISGCGCERAEEPSPPILPGPDKGCVVAGLLLDQAGDPVAEVAVTATLHATCNAFEDNPPPRVESSTRVTDRQGKFRIAGLGKYRYNLEAVQGDLRAHDSISFTEDRTFHPEHLLWLEAPTPETTQFLGGIVHDSAGNPVEGAVVFLLSIDMEGKIDPDTALWTSTDRMGKFGFDHLDWNRWEGAALFARGAGLGTALAEFMSFGVRDAILTLADAEESPGVVKDAAAADGGSAAAGASLSEIPEAAGYIQGRVVDTDNRLVAGAVIRAVHKDGWDKGHGKAHTGLDGSFRMGCTSTGVYIVTAEYGRYFSPRVRARAHKSRPAEVTLELEVVGGFVQGSVRQPDGTPYRGAFVNAEGLNGVDYLNDRIMNPDGTFRLGPLRRGRYAVFAHRDYRNVSDPYPSKESKRVEVELEPGGYVSGINLICEGFMQWQNRPAPTGPLSISGRVTNENGSPLHRAEVALYGEKRERLRPRVYTDHEGHYGFTRLPKCECHVIVEPPSDLRDGPQAHLRAEREASTGSGAVDLVLKRCFTCAGRIVESETGEPIREFLVGVAQYPNPEMGPRGVLGLDYMFEWTQFTDPEGRFALYTLRPGEPAILGFRAPFRGAEFRKLSAPETDGAVDVEIALKPGAKLVGSVLDETGEPVAGAYVEVQPPGMFQFSGRDGGFKFDIPAVEETRTRILATAGVVQQGTDWIRPHGTAWVKPEAGSTTTVQVVLKIRP